MVAHNGGDYLPMTLAALSEQTRPVDAFIGVDTGSRDNSVALLDDAFGEANVTTFQQGRSGMGDAVKAGLAALAPWDPDRPGADTEWVWLLHDDAAPAPEALAELLHAVERAPSVTVAGCKQLDWNARRRLIDVGLSTSRWAERLTLIEADELDQGQYDGRSDTFAVNSAGMLVRRDVWEELGGFDPGLPGTGDDVDFCWRNRLAGHRVVVVPTARMFHVSHRPHALGSASAARKAQVHLRLKHAVWWKVPLHAAGALLGSLFKLVLSIAVKDPGHGFSQLMATFVALGRPGAVIRGRREAARTRKIRRSVIKGLQTPRREVWAHRRSLIEALGADDSAEDAARTDPLAEQPSGDSTDDFAALTTSERGWVGSGALLAVFLTAAASLIGLSGFFRAEAVSGGALIPLSSKVSDIWHHATSWWIGLGAGLPGHGDPFAFLLWILGLAGGGDANSALAWLLLLAMPLSGLAAWFAAGGRDHAPAVPPRGSPRVGRRARPADRTEPGAAGSTRCAHHDAAAGTGAAACHRHRPRSGTLCRSRSRGPAVHGKASHQAGCQRDTVLDGRCGGGPGTCRCGSSGAVAAASVRPRGCPGRDLPGQARPHRMVGTVSQRRTFCSVRCFRA